MIISDDILDYNKTGGKMSNEVNVGRGFVIPRFKYNPKPAGYRPKFVITRVVMASLKQRDAAAFFLSSFVHLIQSYVFGLCCSDS